jgi:hypothetical protein
MRGRRRGRRSGRRSRRREIRRERKSGKVNFWLLKAFFGM